MSEDFGGWDEVGTSYGKLPHGRMTIRFDGVAKDKTGQTLQKDKGGVWSIATKITRVANETQDDLYWFKLNGPNVYKFLRAASALGVTKDALAAAMPLAKGVTKDAAYMVDHSAVERVFALFAGRTGGVEVTKGQGIYNNVEWLSGFTGPDVLSEAGEAAPF